MRHLCVFIVYRNTDDIIKSFESLEKSNMDFFIIENHSENSNEIEKFFSTKKLVGYIQFEKNAAANASNIFIRDFFNFISNYDYVTLTDGDIYLHDINETINEILLGFTLGNCIVSSCDLYMGNHYNNKNRTFGVSHYDEFSKNRYGLPINNAVGMTGHFLVTLQKKDLFLLKDIHYTDVNIRDKITNHGGLWLKTTKNLAYHLTWDTYVDGNPYYEWKKSVYPKIWEKSSEDFKYKRIV